LSVVVVEKAIQARGTRRLLRLEGIARTRTHTHTHTGRQVTLAHCVWVNGPPRGQGRGETAMGREIRGGLWCEGLCANGVGFDRGHRGPLSGTPHETPRGETALARGIMAHHGEGESRYPCRHLSVAEGSHCLLPQYATPSGHPRSTGVTPLQSPGDPTAHRGPGWIGAGDAAVESLLLPLLLLRRPPLPRRPVGGHPSEGDLRGCRGGGQRSTAMVCVAERDRRIPRGFDNGGDRGG